MTYKINGTDLLLQPTTGQWMPREKLGIDGNGHPIYPSIRSFEMVWVLSYPDHYNQLLNFFEGNQVTGTAVVDLPNYRSASYGFTSYSGCVINEPDFSNYFNEHHQEIRLTISSIRV